ncbi:hypothetical protein [Saccharopolyspora sp. 6V]|uniref:hypothetical protein n=1 Tax=Saccharopolyspora sp. 6V TaxID=2877239 RepID=UPI001CD5365D|nr:hypothetical protein [Saccharopolyspora sp. 6V]MCA1194495.1 hypothetical protein [Saccharopolyspora sp. 6V]
MLIDVENVIGGKAPRDDVIRARVSALLAAVPGASAVAFFARHGDAEDERMSRTFRDLGVTTVLVDREPDAADNAILAHARTLSDRGHERFVVASADGALARIADLGALRVLAWKHQPVARQLRSAATEITLLDRPEAVASPRKPSNSVASDSPTRSSSRGWVLWRRRARRRRAKALLPAGTPNPRRAVFWEIFANWRYGVEVCSVYFSYSAAAQLIPSTVGPLMMVLLVGMGGAAFLGFVIGRWRQLCARAERTVAVMLWKSLLACCAAQESPSSAGLHRAQRLAESAALVAEKDLARGGRVLRPHEQVLAGRVARHVRTVLLTDATRPLAEQLQTLERELVPVTTCFLNRNWTAAACFDTAPTAESADEESESPARLRRRRYLRRGTGVGALAAVIALSWSSQHGEALWSLSGLAVLALAATAASAFHEPREALSTLLGRN